MTVHAPLAAALGLGFLLGVRHALDADHVVAVSTIVAQNRDLKRSSLIGAFWGLGHTFTLLMVGTAILVLKLSIPERWALGAELVVGLMLVLLGLLVMQRLWRERWHLHAHEHNGQAHVHWHSHQETVDHEHTHLPYKSLFVGMVHGLAGSAALMLLVLATMKSVGEGILYVLVFGLGSIGGMMVITTAISVPFLWASQIEGARRTITTLAGVISIGLGLAIMYDISSQLLLR